MVITDVNQITYNGNGSQTAWPFTFEFIDATDIKLQLIDADGARHDITSDYYVDVVNKTVYYPGYAPGSEPPEEEQPPKVQDGQKIEIYRRVPVNQLANLGEKWPFSVIEKGLDKLTMICQDIYSWISRNILGLAEGELAWDAKNFPIHNVGGPVDVNDAATKDYVDKILSGIIESGDGRIVPYDTVAQMREGELVAGQIAATLGYYDINDGGHAVYAIRAAIPGDTDDGGSIIILDNGNVAELITDGTVNVKQFGAMGDGVNDDTTAIKNAVAYVESKKCELFIPEGTYIIEDSIAHLTGDSGNSFPKNGITIKGAGCDKTIIKASASITVPMVKLDGNMNNETLSANWVMQNNDVITDITFNGNSVAECGLYLRGVCFSTFKNLRFENFAGSSTTGAIYFDGYASSPDVDTSLENIFENVFVLNCSGNGALCDQSRVGRTIFIDCQFRNCTYNGMSMAYAGLSLVSCSFAGNRGYGFRTIQSASQLANANSYNRSLVIDNCQFENNYYGEIYIPFAHGVVINGGVITPYYHTANQTCINIGAIEVDGVVVNGIRFAGYTGADLNTIIGIKIGDYASNIDLNGISFDRIGVYCWYDDDKRYSISQYATNIKIEGRNVSQYNDNPSFAVTLTNNASAVANLTGDATEVTLPALFAGVDKTILYQNGPAQDAISFYGSISGTTLTVTSIEGTPIRIGDKVAGIDIRQNLYITGYGTGTGGTGTYTINHSATADVATRYIVKRTAFDTETGVFTAPETGLYSFNIFVPLIGVNTGHDNVILYLFVNTTKYSLVRDVLDGAMYAGSKLVSISAEKTVFLNKGDTVNASFLVQGGTKTVGVFRNFGTQVGFLFEGKKVQ